MEDAVDSNTTFNSAEPPVYKFQYANPFRPPDRRMKAPEDKNSFVVSKVWERHKEIARRIALGQKNVHIAQALGISEMSVSQTRNSPIIKERVESLADRMDDSAVDVGKRIKSMAPQALKVLEAVLEDEENTVPLSLKIKTAHDILDRAGHAAIKQINANVLHGHFTATDLAEIKQIARDSGVIVDVVAEDV
jgi:hypothetical protein